MWCLGTLLEADLAVQSRRLDLMFLGTFSDSTTANTRVAHATASRAALSERIFPRRAAAAPRLALRATHHVRRTPGLTRKCFRRAAPGRASASARQRAHPPAPPAPLPLPRRFPAASRSVSVPRLHPSQRCAMLLRGRGAEGPWGRLALLLLLLACATRASEITFELPDNAKQCFYEEIAQGTKCTLEFQVAGRPGWAPRGVAQGVNGGAVRAAVPCRASRKRADVL